MLHRLDQLKWIGYIYLDNSERTKPAFLNSTNSRCVLGKTASYLSLIASILLAVACLLVSVAQPAFADDRIDQNRIGPLSLTCEFERSPVANLSFSLWYVASVDESGSYKLAPEFADCGADLNALSLSTEWDATAKSIISWLGQPASVEPCATGSSSPTGIAAFSRLKPGIYLVSGASTIQGGYRYAISPCLISVPHLNAQETAWSYNVTAIPKIEQLPADAEDPNAPNASNSERADEAAAGPFGLSKTGDYAPLFALALMAIALAALVWMTASRRKRRNHHIGRYDDVHRQRQRLTAFWDIETSTDPLT